MLLAAGSGRRYGRPKALVDNGSGPWVSTSLQAMAGCDEVLVVVGAAATEVAALIPREITVVDNPAHESGMGSSLAAGLAAVPESADAALIMLVDLPDVTAPVIDRVLAAVKGPNLPGVLARAAYRGRPGHPVVMGRDHLRAAAAEAGRDAGARNYLAGRPVTLIECGDLAGGADVDRPPDAG